MAPKIRSSKTDYLATILEVTERDILEAVEEVKKSGVPLQKRLLELKESGEWNELRKQGQKSDEILKSLEPDLYAKLHQNTKKLKSYRRFLGTVLETDSNFLKKHGLIDQLMDLKEGASDADYEEYLAKLKRTADNWDSNIAYYKKSGNKFRKALMKAGHHPTSLSLLRDELARIGYTPEGRELRRSILNLAKEQGWKIGEEYMSYIDPFAHKPNDFKGILEELFPSQKGLSKKLRFKGDKWIPLFELAKDRYAHPWWMGGTTGNILPTDTIDLNLSAAENIKKFEPFLEMEKATDISSKGFDSALESVLRDLKGGKISGEDQTLAALSDRLSKVPSPNIQGLTDAAFRANLIGKARLARVKAGLITGVNKLVGGARPSFAGTVDIAERLTPSDENIALGKEHGYLSQEFLKGYGKQVALSSSMLKMIEGGFSLVGRYGPNAIKPALASFGGAMNHPAVLIPAAIGVGHNIDQKIFDGKIGDTLNEIKSDVSKSVPVIGEVYNEESKDLLRKQHEEGSTSHLPLMPF